MADDVCRALEETGRLGGDKQELSSKLAQELTAGHHSRQAYHQTHSPTHSQPPSEEAIKYGELIVVG